MAKIVLIGAGGHAFSNQNTDSMFGSGCRSCGMAVIGMGIAARK